jgi:hypothetical protein
MPNWHCCPHLLIRAVSARANGAYLLRGLAVCQKKDQFIADGTDKLLSFMPSAFPAPLVPIQRKRAPSYPASRITHSKSVLALTQTAEHIVPLGWPVGISSMEWARRTIIPYIPRPHASIG